MGVNEPGGLSQRMEQRRQNKQILEELKKRGDNFLNQEVNLKFLKERKDSAFAFS